MDATSLLPYLSGPASAVLVLLLVGYAVWRLIDQKLIPLAERFVSRHLTQIDKLIEAHDKDREVWAEGLRVLRTDIDEVRDDVADIRQRIDSVIPKPKDSP